MVVTDFIKQRGVDASQISKLADGATLEVA
jgi:hypothetical protein